MMKAEWLKGCTVLELILDPDHKRHQMLICAENLDPDPNLAHIHAQNRILDLDPTQGLVPKSTSKKYFSQSVFFILFSSLTKNL